MFSDGTHISTTWVAIQYPECHLTLFNPDSLTTKQKIDTFVKLKQIKEFEIKNGCEQAKDSKVFKGIFRRSKSESSIKNI